MADLRESFPTLENTSTQAGVALGARVEGDAATAINGAIGFSFKDASGNVVLPQLNTAGQLPVTSEKSGNGKYARGTHAGSGSLQTIATLTLTANKVYEEIAFVVSSFRDSNFQLIWNNNGSETILADALAGPGSLTAPVMLPNLEFTAGATGTQQLLVKGLNVNATSSMYATVSCKELV